MQNIIASIILFGSLAGIGTILFKKFKVLSQMPAEEIEEKRFQGFTAIIKERFTAFRKRTPVLSDFSYLGFLQKILSKILVLIMRVEAKANNYLQRVRQKALEKQQPKPDDYWHDLKAIVKGKKQEKARSINEAEPNAWDKLRVSDNSKLPEAPKKEKKQKNLGALPKKHTVKRKSLPRWHSKKIS